MFQDRYEAGRMIAHHLAHVCPEESVVLGIARGGVPVAYEVARRLAIPLDVLVVRRIAAARPEGATIGAAGEDGVVVGNRVPPDALRRARDGIDRQVRAYRARRAAVPLRDRTVIVVDDGIASGATARAACRIVRDRGARRVVFAAPVVPAHVVPELCAVADDLPRIVTPARVPAIAPWYVDFPPLTDDDVGELLGRLDDPVDAG
ncbi:MAG TPA: phosphoribosyltransferase family protein [Actinocatenispora sp.]